MEIGRQSYSATSPVRGEFQSKRLWHFTSYKSVIHIGVSIVMGVPQGRLLVYFMENPNLKWMMTGGTPMTLETSIL